MGNSSAADGLGRRSAAIVLWLLGLCLAVVLCPRVPFERGPGYDRSFALGLNAAHAQGVVFGHDLVYPYGPLGWVAHPLPVGGDLGLAFAMQALACAALLAALLLLARRVGGGWTAVWCLAIVGAADLVDPLAPWLVHLEYLVPVVGLLAFATTPARRLPALIALSGVAAAVFLVKLDAGVYAAVLCAGLAIATAAGCRAAGDGGALARRTIWAPPAAFLLALAALYGLESRRLDTLPAFLRDSVPVVLGYTEMAVDGEPANLLLMLAALAAAFLLLPALGRDRRTLTAALALVAVPAFLLWQRVALRQDVGHQVSMLPRLAVLLLFPFVAAARRDRVLVAALQVVLLVVGGVFVARQFPDSHVELADRLTGRQVRQMASALGDWSAWSAGLAEESRALGSELRLRAGSHAIVGRRTVDAVPWKLERVFAQGWSWRPRPALQDGNAYTPRLDGLDAAHFSGERAPDFVLADFGAIDGRHLFLEAPLSWRALLDRYDVRLAFPQVLLLERRTGPRFGAPRTLGRVAAGWDQELAVPESDELVLLSCDIRPGLAGRATGLVYRTAPVQLDARYRDGTEIRWRTVRPNLVSGAIVSPLPSSLDGLRAVLESGAGEVDRVAAVRLHTDEPWQYDDELAVEWWELPLAEGQRPWRVDLPPIAARWELLDDGGDGGPTLRLVGEPRLGQRIELVVAAERPGPALLLVSSGHFEASGPLGRLHVDPEHMLLVPIETDGSGAARLGLTVPDQRRLAGLDVRVQVASGEAGRWRLGEALELLIGR